MKLKNRLTFLFYGKPGCGKTTVAMSIAKKLNRDIYFYPKNSEQIKITDIPISESVIVFDDVDFLNLEKRIVEANDKEEKPNSKLIQMMEILDGYTIKENNIVIILITNHKDKLDEAVVRNGRIDAGIKFEGLNEIQMYNKLWKRFYEKDLQIEDEKLERILLNSNFTISEIWSKIIYPNKFNEEDAKKSLMKLIHFEE